MCYYYYEFPCKIQPVNKITCDIIYKLQLYNSNNNNRKAYCIVGFDDAI